MRVVGVAVPAPEPARQHRGGGWPRRPNARLRRASAWLQDVLPGTPLPSDTTGLTGVTSLWLGLSILFALFCGVCGLVRAFAEPYLVQDDARTFLFWMERFFDPALFPNDLMADYFEAVSPPGYTALHWLAAVGFGIDPFVLNKLLPIVLSLIMTVYVFLCCMELYPVPAAAFAAATILNEATWLADAIPSGTPRAFIYPIFLALLYAVLRRRTIETLIWVLLLGLFYPQLLSIALGMLVLGLVCWERRPSPERPSFRLLPSPFPGLTRDRRAYLVCVAAILTAALPLAWALLQTSRFGPVVTAAQAQQMGEFSASGRTSFYFTNPWHFWITGERPGFLPYGLRPPLIWLGVLLPLLVLRRRPLATSHLLSVRSRVLIDITLASVAMYAIAHLFLFTFHLPSRYTQHSLRIVLSLAAGISLAMLLDAALGRLNRLSVGRWLSPGTAQAALGAGLFGALVLYPGSVVLLERLPFPFTQYLPGREPGLYQYLERQPKDILIASLGVQVDMLPSFAHRSILTGFEYGIPYHVGYYSQIQQRSRDLISVQYTLDRAEVREFVERYHVTYFLLNRQAYIPYYVETSAWIQELQPEGMNALAALQGPALPILARVASKCQAYTSDRYVLVDAACAVSATLG